MKNEETVKTLNVLSLACLIGYFIFKTPWLIIVSTIILFLAITGGRVSFFIAKGWLGFSNFLGKINSKIILTLVFYLILTPIACLYRIFNKDRVKAFTGRQESSYYKEINLTYKKDHFEKLW